LIKVNVAPGMARLILDPGYRWSSDRPPLARSVGPLGSEEGKHAMVQDPVDASQAAAGSAGAGGGERMPVMQAVLDNPFLLLFIGVAVPTLSYLIWGIMDIILIPIGK
jgi:hypothetical protein